MFTRAVFIQKITLEKAIEFDFKERNALVQDADIYIDTTSLSIKAFRFKLYNRLSNHIGDNITTISFISFGYKKRNPL